MKLSPDKAEKKAASEPLRSPETGTKEAAAKDDSKWSRVAETESPERPPQKDRHSPALETKGRESKKQVLTTEDARTDLPVPLFSKQDSPKSDRSPTLDDHGSTATEGGPCPKDSNSGVADKAKSPVSDTTFNKLKRRLAKSKSILAKKIKIKEINALASPEETNGASAREAADYVTQGKQPSEKKKAKEKTRVVTVVKDWNTIKKPVINFANIRHFRLAHGNKKSAHKEPVEDDRAAGQAPTKKPDSEPPAAVDSVPTTGRIEAPPENNTTDNSGPVQNEVTENGATDSQQPLNSTSDKEGCASELSEGEIRSESQTKEGDSANNSPRSNNVEEEPEVFSTKKRRKGAKIKKKRRSLQRESTQSEDSGDESPCSESSTYYQLVKKPKKKKKKPAKDRKKSLKKKTKADSARMSRKAAARKSRRRARTPSEEEDDDDSESSTSYDSPPAKRTKTKKSKKRTRRSPVAKRDGSRKSSTGSTKAKKSSKKKSTSTGKKGSKASFGAKAASSKTKSKRKLSSDSSSSSSSSESPERKTRRKAKTVKKSKKVKRKKCK